MTFADCGPGVPSEVVDRLFEPFVTTKPHGLGMGLSISRRIIEAHGGELVLESSDRRGATFRVDLPVSTEVRAP
jgi:two-component system sensor kinase FixL